MYRGKPMPGQATKWSIEFFPGGDVDGPALKDIQGVKDAEARAEITHWIVQLGEFGPYHWLESKRVRKVRTSHEDVFELRVSYHGQAFRVLFCRRGQVIWILHFVVTKKQNLDKRDVQLADGRAKRLT
jgi:putative component of toxin-antitoxin plasmid stabilization module